MSGYCLPWAAIDWATPQTPRSTQHDDIYWSRDQGLAEKQHVFVDGGDIKARFELLERGHFTLAEIGFGFGLNFLLTVEAWREAARGSLHTRSALNYIAIEREPVSPADLAQCFERLGLNSSASKTLLEKFPVPVPGWHVIAIADDINLILGLGDAAYLLDDLDADVDAWYLDGFSPRVNETAWAESLMQAMANVSRPGATVTTYSVAGVVRRGLEAAGLEVSKRPGYGTKAEMLFAQVEGNWIPATFSVTHVGIVGAGIAGLMTARALSRRGIDVTLFDRGETCSGASGSPALAVYPQLSASAEFAGQFSLTAFCFASAHYRTLHRTGRCQLADNAETVARFQQIANQLPGDVAQFLDAQDVSQILGLDCRHPALYFAAAGHLSVREEFSEEFDVRPNEIVRAVSGHHIETAAGTFTFDAVVIANGHEDLPQTALLGCEPVRGQNIIAALDPGPKAVVGGPISIIPIEGQLGGQRGVVGGTYSKQETDIEPRVQDTLGLVALAQRYFDVTAEPESAWAGIRSTTRDRQPIAGPLPDWQALDAWCDAGTASSFQRWDAGLFTLTGLGSHGATTAPLLAEHIARQITGEAGCLGRTGAGRLSPARFALRDAGRRREISSLSVDRQRER